VAAAAGVAGRLRQRLHDRAEAATRRGAHIGLRRARASDAPFVRIRVNPAKPVPFRSRPIQPRAARTGRDGWSTISGSVSRPDVVALRVGGPDGAGEDQRAADRESRRVDERTMRTGS